MASVFPIEINGPKINAPGIGAVVPPNPSIRCKDYVRDYCSSPCVVQNQANFERSGTPSRLMFYREGSWIDFSSQVLENVRAGFLERKPVMDVCIDGSQYLFDFLKMLQIDILTGNERSIAWIDVNRKCFFPKVFVSEEAAKMSVGGDLGKRKKAGMEFQEESDRNSSNNQGDVSRRWNSKNQEADSKRQRIEMTYDSDTSKWPNAKLIEKEDRAYAVAEKFFLSRFKDIDPAARVTAIHQCTWKGPLEKARWEVFHKQLEMTGGDRGTCNATFAWHGTSAKAMASILTYGFGMRSHIDGSESHGFGICLSSVRLPHISAMASEADGNGEKHVLLCRVILGNVERVEAGALPSSVSFDTGVDDFKNPTWYVIRWANVNTHILPQCVVSYKSSDDASGQMRGLDFLKWAPYSSNSFVVKLFSKLENMLPSKKVQELESWCKKDEVRNLERGKFLEQLRAIVGDAVLDSTIKEIHGSE